MHRVFGTLPRTRHRRDTSAVPAAASRCGCSALLTAGLSLDLRSVSLNVQEVCEVHMNTSARPGKTTARYTAGATWTLWAGASLLSMVQLHVTRYTAVW